MGRKITRRDFLNGVSVGVGGAVVSASGVLDAETLLAAAALDEISAQNAPGYYPPAKMGMRGNHDGSFTFAHLMRDGQSWNDLGKAAATGESYDLIVVGGGISGLASAYFYRQR